MAIPRSDHGSALQHIGFPKRVGLSIQNLHSKSVIFAVPLNFFNKPLFRVLPTVQKYVTDLRYFDPLRVVRLANWPLV